MATRRLNISGVATARRKYYGKGTSAPRYRSEFLKIENVDEVLDRLGLMEARTVDPSLAFELGVFGLLEAREKEVFEAWHSKYVESGATMRSLTEPLADHAIRRAHGSLFEFGSSVWYARFQGLGSSGLGKGYHRRPSAILRVTRQQLTSIVTELREYILFGSAGARV